VGVLFLLFFCFLFLLPFSATFFCYHDIAKANENPASAWYVSFRQSPKLKSLDRSGVIPLFAALNCSV